MPFSPLSRTGWVVTPDSTAFSSPVANAYDGNNSTFWHSDSGYPHYLTVDMGSAQTFNAVQFVPRGGTDPAQVAVYVSDDGSTWGSPVATDTWVSGSSTKYLTFTSVTKRWFRFQGNTGADNAYMAVAEIYAGVFLPASELRETHVVLEYLREAPPAFAAGVRETQAGLEHVDFPPNDVRESQVCLEVVLPGGWCPPCPPAGGKRNHSFIGTSFSLQ